MNTFIPHSTHVLQHFNFLAIKAHTALVSSTQISHSPQALVSTASAQKQPNSHQHGSLPGGGLLLGGGEVGGQPGRLRPPRRRPAARRQGEVRGGR